MSISLSSFDQSGRSYPHDLSLDAEGNLHLVTGREEARQRLFVYLLTTQGDWFYDRSLGVPYRDIIKERGRFVEKLNRLEQEMLEVDGVSEVHSNIDYDPTTRTLYVKSVVRGEE